MPTLLACAEQLEITRATADQDPTADLEALADAGIDMDDVTEKLLRDGIEKFVKPFDAADRGRRADARGHRHRPAAHDPVLDPRRARAGDRRARGEGESEHVASADLAARTRRSGAAPARPRSATAWAG